MDVTHPNSRGLVFIFSVLSLVPLVNFHDIATGQLATRIGGSKTGLVNASLSNMVEIVVAISALRKCELRVVQSSLIGSMLSKLCTLLHSLQEAIPLKQREKCSSWDFALLLVAYASRSNVLITQLAATQLHSSLLSLSVSAVLLPAAYHFALSTNSDIASQLQWQNILSMSHGVSVVLLFIYGSYLFFQLCSHTHLYQHGKKQSARQSSGFREDVLYRGYDPDSSPVRLPLPRSIYLTPRSAYSASDTTLAVAPQHRKDGTDSGSGGIPMSRGSTSSNESNAFLVEKQETNIHDEESGLIDERKPRLSLFLTVVLLMFAVAIIADRLVESMDSIDHTIQKPYVALIILPAVSSVAECMTAMTVSVKDLNFAISVAVGSTIQTALFVIPLMVTLAWGMGKPLALLFDPFESLVLYISVQVMTSVMADGKSNYLEGIILICLYLVIAVSFWFYPAWSPSSSLAVCGTP
ncbi:hypothetical protein K438DRAFT_1963450 [Mycena galopus ATCC 62051]|nr:hypothetical protein K438DRAFT_1963450 [Mycena galopus ATCC 62051]